MATCLCAHESVHFSCYFTTTHYTTILFMVIFMVYLNFQCLTEPNLIKFEPTGKLSLTEISYIKVGFMAWIRN